MYDIFRIDFPNLVALKARYFYDDFHSSKRQFNRIPPAIRLLSAARGNGSPAGPAAEAHRPDHANASNAGEAGPAVLGLRLDPGHQEIKEGLEQQAAQGVVQAMLRH